MKKLIITSLILVSGFLASGQGTEDALRFSRMNYQGTARFNAMGGSFGALGGEITSLMINPAGIGVYRNSEFTFSAALLTNSMESNFRNGLVEDNAVNFNIPNIGFVNTYKGDANGWKNYSLGFSHSRVNTFKSDYLFRGSNTNGSSFIDPYVTTLNDANANTEDLINYDAFPFGPAQAFYTVAIDTFRRGNGDLYYDRWLLGEESIDQTKKVESSGRQSETNVSFGGNYQDRLYLGANLGIQNIRFEQNIVRTEKYNYSTPPPAGVTDITDYSETTSLLTLGTGVNFKLGAIYRLNDAIRLGAAIHTPTYFGMSEEYSVEASSVFSDGNAYKSEVVESNYEYQFRTPMRLNASLAWIYGKQGLLNVDYEYVDYSTARFDDSRNFDYDYSFVNNNIKNQLAATHNLRFGTELRFDPFVARAGFRYEGNPYSNKAFLNPDENRKTYSIGGGFRTKNFNFDMSYAFSQMNFIDPFYETSDAIARVASENHLVTMTFGWKW